MTAAGSILSQKSNPMSIQDASDAQAIHVTVKVPVLRGEILDELRKHLKERLAERSRTILLSLPETKLMDSQGVSLLLYFHHILKREKLTLRILEPGPDLQVFLRNMALDFLL